VFTIRLVQGLAWVFQTKERKNNPTPSLGPEKNPPEPYTYVIGVLLSNKPGLCSVCSDLRRQSLLCRAKKESNTLGEILDSPVPYLFDLPTHTQGEEVYTCIYV